MLLRHAPALALAAVLVFGLIGLTLVRSLAIPGLDVANGGFVERQVATDPPSLWLAEALKANGALQAASEICADRAIREAFVHPLPRFNDEPCRRSGAAVDRPGLYAVRCEAFGRRYSVNATRHGDLDHDFTVDFAVQPLDAPGAGYRQIVRYRRQGACPGGWRNGDTAPHPLARAVESR